MKGHCQFGLKVFSCLSMQNFRNVFISFFIQEKNQPGLKDELKNSSFSSLRQSPNVFIVNFIAAFSYF